MRPDFTTPPRSVVWTALQPSWMLSVRADTSAMRRIWSIRPSAVAPRCWRWLTQAYGPPHNGPRV